MEHIEAELANVLVAELAEEMGREGLGLAPDTRSRLAELFAGKCCCRCGGPAARLAGGRFYCVGHYLRGRAQVGAAKVYRCEVA